MPTDQPASLPRILADLPLSASIAAMFQGRAELLPWSAAGEPAARSRAASAS